jgi:hypothetical protein
MSTSRRRREEEEEEEEEVIRCVCGKKGIKINPS